MGELLVFGKLKCEEDVRAFSNVAAVLQRRWILFKDPFVTGKWAKEKIIAYWYSNKIMQKNTATTHDRHHYQLVCTNLICVP